MHVGNGQRVDVMTEGTLHLRLPSGMILVFYVHAPDRDGLCILDLVTHINSVDVKRCKHGNDNATNIWHCRLGHIGVKRMKKLHQDVLLDSLD
jgi:hypothetical protein